MSSHRRKGNSASKTTQNGSTKLILIKETKNNSVKVQHFSIWLDQVVKLIQTTINTKSAQLFLAGNFEAIVEHNTKIVNVRLQQTDLYGGRRQSNVITGNAKTPVKSSLGERSEHSFLHIETPNTSISAIPSTTETFSLLTDLQHLGDISGADEEEATNRRQTPNPTPISLENVHSQGQQALLEYCKEHNIPHEQSMPKQMLLVRVTVHLAETNRQAQTSSEGETTLSRRKKIFTTVDKPVVANKNGKKSC